MKGTKPLLFWTYYVLSSKSFGSRSFSKLYCRKRGVPCLSASLNQLQAFAPPTAGAGSTLLLLEGGVPGRRGMGLL